MFELTSLLRKNIFNLKPYSCARHEYQGKEAIFLDANENPFNTPLNRYPDPLQHALKAKLCDIKQVKENQVFLGNGSDEAIDLLFRVFCEPKEDNVISIYPSYGMYQVCADINNVAIQNIPINPDFTLDVSAILQAVNTHTKLIFLCSPNNPTANYFNEKDMIAIIKGFNGLVVVDEAYIDFATQKGFLARLEEFPNLVILQTLSKAWGHAGIRLGMAYASAEIIHYMNNVKYPYNINQLTQEAALRALENEEQKNKWVNTIIEEKGKLITYLQQHPLVKHIYPSDTNYLMVKFDEPKKIYTYLVSKQIVVRDRSSLLHCDGCLRITIGTEEENALLVDAMNAY